MSGKASEQVEMFRDQANTSDGGVSISLAQGVLSRPLALPPEPCGGKLPAVLAVGVVPHIVSAVAVSLHSYGVGPYWLESLQLTATSACTIFVTVYLIGRSGESWKRFGLCRPRFLDLFLGLAMFIAARLIYWFGGNVVVLNNEPLGTEAPPSPQGPLDLVLMVIKWGTSGFAEELVTRAYLITRLEVLLQSRTLAVLATAVLFASYHVYIGTAGVYFAVAFGLVYGSAYLVVRRVWPLALGHALTNIRLDLLS